MFLAGVINKVGNVGGRKRARRQSTADRRRLRTLEESVLNSSSEIFCTKLLS